MPIVSERDKLILWNRKGEKEDEKERLGSKEREEKEREGEEE